VDTAQNATDGAPAVLQIMQNWASENNLTLSDEDNQAAKGIYIAVLNFLDNTGFSPPLRPKSKY
jgi:hypothetical protein